jgi:hypothetical protein
MELVVEDFVLAETLRENSGDLRDEVPLFAGKRKGNAKAFRTHTPDSLLWSVSADMKNAIPR